MKRLALLALVFGSLGLALRAAEPIRRQDAVAVQPVSQDSDVIEVGKDNWDKPTMPDLAAGKGTISIPVEKRIDVLILGNGYLPEERERFVSEVNDWYNGREGFLTLTPWSQLRGAFRVRGYWTPSDGRSTADRKSHYQLSGTAGNQVTSERIFDAMRKTNCNLAARNGAITHTAVVMLIRDAQGRNPSGVTRPVNEPSSRLSVRVAFGAYLHHEFGHAFGGMRDEYINGVESHGKGNSPEHPSIFSVSNLSYTKDPAHIPWKHLLPGGEANPDKDSVIGLLWMGGRNELDVWHSEGKCLMNGTHDNWDFDKTKRGVGLRNRNQFCFWCEETIVARAWERTGQFGDMTDGVTMYEKWEREIRPLYYKYFDVPKRIAERNEKNRLAGWQDAKLFERPAAAAGGNSPSPSQEQIDEPRQEHAAARSP